MIYYDFSQKGKELPMLVIGQSLLEDGWLGDSFIRIESLC